jgi:hypothetical protein
MPRLRQLMPWLPAANTLIHSYNLIWYLWWAQWYRERLSSEFFCFALLVTFPSFLHTHTLPSPEVFSTHDQSAYYLVLRLELLGIKGQLFPLRFDYGRSPHAYVNQRLQIQLELLMMSGIPLETCWAVNEWWNNKFCYKVASCWLLLLSQLYLWVF